MFAYYDNGNALVAGLALYFVLWLLFATAFGFSGRAIMRSKGRSTASGFCLGFFLGVVGLLIASLLSTTPEYEAEKMRRQMALMGLSPVQAQAYGPPGTPIASGVYAPQTAARRVGYGPWFWVAGVCTALAVVCRVALASSFGVLVSGLLGVLAAIAVVLVLSVESTASRTARPDWWRPSVLVTGVLVVAASLTSVLGQHLLSYDRIYVIPPLLFAVGAGLSVAALLSPSSKLGKVAIGWMIFVVVLAFDEKLTLVGYDNKSESTVVLLGSIVLGVLGIWLVQQRPSEDAATPTPMFSAPVAVVASAPTALHATTTASPAQWAPDPYKRHEHRFWNGTGWTDQVADGGVFGIDPATQTPSVPSLISPVSSEPAMTGLRDGHTVGRGQPSKALPVLLVFDAGQRTTLTTPLVVGREPISLAHVPGASLVSYPDATMTVSKTHFAIGPDVAGVWIEDISSSNGTIVVNPGGVETPLEPGRRLTTQVGSVIRFGDRWLRVEQIS